MQFLKRFHLRVHDSAVHGIAAAICLNAMMLSVRLLWLSMHASFVVIYGQNDQCSDAALSINSDADAKFTVITTLRTSPDGVQCGQEISIAEIQNVAVMQWVVDRMNAGNFINGVRLGFDVYDDCGIFRNTIGRALDVFDGAVLGSSSCTNRTACQIGIISATRSNNTEDLLNALRGTSLPVISPYATFDSLTRYSNFFRTVPSDRVQIEAIVDVLKTLNLTYIAVVATDDEYGRQCADILRELGKQHGVCVDNNQYVKTGQDIEIKLLLEQLQRTKDSWLRVVFFGSKNVFMNIKGQLSLYPNTKNITWLVAEHSEEYSSFDAATDLDDKTIVFSRNSVNLSELYEYVQNKWNHVLSTNQTSDDSERLMMCSRLNKVPKWTNQNVQYIIDTIFILASSLQRQKALHCLQSESVCKLLREHFKFEINELKSQPVVYINISTNVTVKEFAEMERSVTFTTNRELKMDDKLSVYDINIVNSLRTFTKLGDYRNNSFSLFNINSSAIRSVASSRCNDSCPACFDTSDISFGFLDGDAYLLGIFPVHERNSNDPFQCSKFRLYQRDVITIESFLYTVDALRNETGIKFGAIILDDCYSSVRIELIVSNIFSGAHQLIKPGTHEIINVKKIVAAICTGGSSVAITLDFLLSELNIPVISSAASSPDLDDRLNHPYFLRTVPSDVDQAKAMVKIIQSMGWHYVSMLYVHDNYGIKGTEAFIRLASQSGICVASSPEGVSDIIDNRTSSEFKSAVTRLNNQKADMVVYFGTETVIVKFLEVINGINNFIFLGSEDWGGKRYILQNGTLGSLTLEHQINSILDMTLLGNYLKSLTPHDTDRNPWIIEYWENNFKCDLPQSLRNVYNKQCDSSAVFSDADIAQFLSDPRIVHAVSAVRAVALGVQQSKDLLCKLEPSFPCPKYFIYPANVTKNIREVKVMRDGQEVRVFNDDGNGNVGFKINNIQESENKSLKYVEVGSYEMEELTLQNEKLMFYNPKLDGKCLDTRCSHCENQSISSTTTFATTTKAQFVDKEFTKADYVIFGILALLLMVILILFICTICYFRSRITELETRLKQTKYEPRTGYSVHNGSAISSTTHPMMQISNTTTNGDTLYEMQLAKYAAKSNSRLANGDMVNNNVVGSDINIHASDEKDKNKNHSNTSHGEVNTNPHHLNHLDQTSYQSVADSKVYKPPSTSYGKSTHSSFKRPVDTAPQNNFKKQPRTQLAVLSSRPELPPRDQQHKHVNRPHTFPEGFDDLRLTFPKETVQKLHSNKSTVSPKSLQNMSSFGDASSYMDTDNTPDKGINILYSSRGMTYNRDDELSPTSIDIAGSLERVSRV